jgi:hypothetical protein
MAEIMGWNAGVFGVSDFNSPAIKGRKMRSVTVFILVNMIALISAAPASSSSESDINAKLAQLDTNSATLSDVIRVFGEPTKYVWGGETFSKDNLPSTYIAIYPNGFCVVFSRGRINELRFEGPDSGYQFEGKLQVGSSLEEVLKVIGTPGEVVEGQAMPKIAKDGVLYKDIDRKKGYCYYGRADRSVRFFFADYKVSALYVTSRQPAGEGGQTLKTTQPVTSVKEFDDVRSKDLSKLDLSSRKNLIATLTFNQKTGWPEPNKMPTGDDPNKLLKDAMNPGLGVRELHRQGITGKGINVAIIDQPMYLDHPEFARKIIACYDTGCGSESSMHGPAVTSLLAGTNCGTAPDARVFYAAVPSWKRDTAYEAKALEWIIEQNKKLPAGRKIRVVSVSAAPSGQGAPRDKNQYMWDSVCARAEAAGLLVLDCTNHHGFIGPCWYNPHTPESIIGCMPGYPGQAEENYPGHILVPTCPRTTAEEYNKGDFGYQYYGRGGLSWAIPYCAGVLALGWQINPELGPVQMRELLFKSAYTKKDGAKIINPGSFIQLVRKTKATSRTIESKSAKSF